MKTKSRMSFPVNSNHKPGTAERAEITARLKIPRGRQLVEHNPWELLPDPNNPRPGEVIDEHWLKKVLHLGSEKSLCKLNGKEWVIPEFHELREDTGVASESDYDELRRLALSIRNEGLIQPIEIFLADKKNEPEYFKDNELYYAYVVTEGHRRRLASMMAGLDSIMCVEITDDTMLAKLKVKHRKLRRQLSENNLRKDLTVYQHLTITKELFDSLPYNEEITATELSSITGLNYKICQILKKIVTAEVGRYPEILFERIKDNELSYKNLRALVPKTYDQIIKELITGTTPVKEVKNKNISSKNRVGRQKVSATLKIVGENDTLNLLNYLVSSFPNLRVLEEESPYKNLENIFSQLIQMASESS